MTQPNDTPISVSQITGGIKTLLEAEYANISLYGEISNFKKHSSGHLYFTLKDERAQISAVMFRGNTMNMFFTPRDGMEVVCRGSVTVYEPRGNYQIIVREMYPKGEGALRIAFEKLKQQLFEEGLFDEGSKKPIPQFPSVIAIVTSATGAAIRDMLSVLRRKNPGVEVLLVPVQVQGAGAAEQIAAGIDLCNEYGKIDTIITGRGGGSLEDLWPFNEEIVARAIARSRIPVISAVGHEVDFTISDLAADARAATPSVAADMAVLDRTELLGYTKSISNTLDKFVGLKLENSRNTVTQYSRQRVFNSIHSRIRTSNQMTDERSERMHLAMSNFVERKRHSVSILDSKLAAHNVDRILRKGFAILRNSDSVITSVHQTEKGNALRAQLRDGFLDILVQDSTANNE